MPRLPRCFIVQLSACLIAGALLHAQTPVTYVYDEIGRLVGVINAAGDSATYSYDSVGNLLSISRHAAGGVSLIEFTPNAGPVGATVAIVGIGFSATPASNTVTFNGVAATVSTATTTRLTVTVPVSATTGSIAVTSPSGSATSATTFSVATVNAPTITSFSPSIATIGTALSISGTNFDAVIPNNRAKVNLSPAFALSGSTTTSLSTTVPPATASGRIKVDTALGTALSSSDLFIPPGTNTASDVQYTSRMTYGDSRSVAITTSGKIGLVVFDAALNQRASIKVVPGPTSSVTVYRPNGSSLAARSTGVFTLLVEPGYSPVAGTYTIGVDPSGTGTGTATVTLYDVPADITGTFTPTSAGDAEVVTTTVPGQNGQHTFSGTAGQRISLKISGGPNGTVSILKPDNSTLLSSSIGIFSTWWDPVTLGATGTYKVLSDYLEHKTGTVTNTVYDVPADTTGTVTVNGSAVAVPLSPGQNGTRTFSGTNGQLMTVRMTGNTFGQTTIKLLKPDTSVLATQSSASTNFNMTQQTLPTTGTYTVVVDPSQWNTGTINVAVTNP